MARLRIAELALERGLNQSQLQIRSGVTPPLLNRYWNNNTQGVNLQALSKIARALDVQPGDLIVEELGVRYVEPNYQCLAPGCQERVTASTGTNGYCARHAHLAESE